MKTAPFYDDVADGPLDATAYWTTTSDGVRIRLGHWKTAQKGAGRDSKGTVLLFPGRTEYIEKYGRAAADLGARGYDTFAIDWRGQGLADRLADETRVGHVNNFVDYQHDVTAMTDLARSLDLPRPWYLLAHSMGGAIGLRALMEGLPVQAAAFSAPMWGIGISGSARPAAWAVSWGGSLIGLGHKLAPGTSLDSYVTVEPFEDNKLTTDVAMYEYMQGQAQSHPNLILGGPSLRWLNTSLCETRHLAAQPSPSTPTVTFLGTDERIVDTARVHQRMDHWQAGTLEMIDTAQHEVMMENAPIRQQVFDHCADLFGQHT